LISSASTFSVVVITTTKDDYAFNVQNLSQWSGRLMAEPIISIAKIRAAAQQAVREGVSVHDCPPAFKFVEHLWRAEYWFAHYEMTCKDPDE
jgi:hypothetical protein